MNKFTVVTSCFNAESYISETIESVLFQTEVLKSKCLLEYIIIDGKSTDNTNFIIEQYKKKYPEIIHICEKDEGLYDGLSKGFKLATGNIVCYLNAGDFFNKSAFSILNKVFENKNINWVTGLKVLYNENSEIINIQFPFKYRSNLIRAGIYGKNLPFIQQESTFWRKELLDEVDFNFFKSLKLSGDMYLWFCFANKYKLEIINSYLSGFKYHENQLTFRETNSTKVYLDETKKFIKEKKISTIFWTIVDSPLWFLGRNLNLVLKFFNSNILDFSKKEKSWNIDKFSNKQKYFCWVCDYRQTNGEGITAKMFLDYYSKTHNINPKDIYLRNLDDSTSLYDLNFKTEKLKDLNLNFVQKYLSPFIGILYLWIKFITGKKTMYINFLPLWNFVIFLFLPPNIVLGPITGSKEYNKNEVKGVEAFFRRYLMFIQFRISCNILRFRHKNLIFNTENLKSLLPKKILEKSKFNFVFDLYKSNSLKKDLILTKNRKIDFLFYIRFYPSKGTNLLIKYINILKREYNIATFGERTGENDINEFGKISKDKVKELCNNSKFAFLSLENFYSLFALDCLNSGTKIFFNKDNEFDKQLLLENKIFPINYYDTENSLKIIDQKVKDIN